MRRHGWHSGPGRRSLGSLAPAAGLAARSKRPFAGTNLRRTRVLIQWPYTESPGCHRTPSGAALGMVQLQPPQEATLHHHALQIAHQVGLDHMLHVDQAGPVHVPRRRLTVELAAAAVRGWRSRAQLPWQAPRRMHWRLLTTRRRPVPPSGCHHRVALRPPILSELSTASQQRRARPCAGSKKAAPRFHHNHDDARPIRRTIGCSHKGHHKENKDKQAIARL